MAMNVSHDSSFTRASLGPCLDHRLLCGQCPIQTIKLFYLTFKANNSLLKMWKQIWVNVISNDRKGFSNVIHLMILRVEDYFRLPKGDTLLNPEGKIQSGESDWGKAMQWRNWNLERQCQARAQAAPETGYRHALTVSLAPWDLSRL